MPPAGSTPAWDAAPCGGERAGKPHWYEGFGARLGDCSCCSQGSSRRSFGVPPTTVTGQP